MTPKAEAVSHSGKDTSRSEQSTEPVDSPADATPAAGKNSRRQSPSAGKASSQATGQKRRSSRLSGLKETAGPAAQHSTDDLHAPSQHAPAASETDPQLGSPPGAPTSSQLEPTPPHHASTHPGAEVSIVTAPGMPTDTSDNTPDPGSDAPASIDARPDTLSAAHTPPSTAVTAGERPISESHTSGSQPTLAASAPHQDQAELATECVVACDPATTTDATVTDVVAADADVYTGDALGGPHMRPIAGLAAAGVMTDIDAQADASMEPQATPALPPASPADLNNADAAKGAVLRHVAKADTAETVPGPTEAGVMAVSSHDAVQLTAAVPDDDAAALSDVAAGSNAVAESSAATTDANLCAPVVLENPAVSDMAEAPPIPEVASDAATSNAVASCHPAATAIAAPPAATPVAAAAAATAAMTDSVAPNAQAVADPAVSNIVPASVSNPATASSASLVQPPAASVPAPAGTAATTIASKAPALKLPVSSGSTRIGLPSRPGSLGSGILGGSKTALGSTRIGPVLSKGLLQSAPPSRAASSERKLPAPSSDAGECFSLRL